MRTITWRKSLTSAMEANKETFSEIESSTLTEEQLDQPFDGGYGGEEGCPFTVWTENHVYFPCCYDGAEWVGSVSRNPNGHATEHIGG